MKVYVGMELVFVGGVGWISEKRPCD